MFGKKETMMRKYDKYKDAKFAWMGEIPDHWGMGLLRLEKTGEQQVLRNQ